MVTVNIIAIVSILGLGIITSISDIRNHKAYNKDILLFSCIGLLIQILSASSGRYDVLDLIINMCLAFFTSFFFFAAKIWAAGDAKLFMANILLIPPDFYWQNIGITFPAFVLFGFIFSFALLYVVVESAILFIRDFREGLIGNWKRFLPQPSIRSLLAWGLGYISVNTLNVCLDYMDVIGSSNITIVVSLLFATAIFSLFETVKSQVVLFAVCVIVRILMYAMCSIDVVKFSITTLCIVLLIVLVRSFTSQYNYRIIQTSQVREGQILARHSLIFMMPSSVRGLPKWTDESTRCRLNSEQVAAIKRWEHSKYGKSEISIVRHIPFAPFIFVGTLAYLLIAFYLGV